MFNWPWIGTRALIPVCLSVFLSQNSQAETIKVRIHAAQAPVSLSGFGLSFQGQGPSARQLMLPKFEALKIQRKGDTWRIEDRHSGVLRREISGPSITIQGDTIRMGVHEAPGVLTLWARPRGSKVDVVAHMNIEEYLKGVLPSEMPSHWPLEALKAQAVAARTYAMLRARQRMEARWHLESTVMDQVFDFSKTESLSAQARRNVERAIHETRGQYLVDRNGDVFHAYFHADCGGHTEEAAHVWSGGPKIGTAEDPHCPTGSSARWRLELTGQDLARRLEKPLHLNKNLKLASVSRVEKSPSGRIAHIGLVFSDGTRRTVKGHDLRSYLGFDVLKSTSFALSNTNGKWIFEGRGFGHGVGLCQWGAKSWATRGSDSLRILRHYYPQAQLKAVGERKTASTLTGR